MVLLAFRARTNFILHVWTRWHLISQMILQKSTAWTLRAIFKARPCLQTLKMSSSTVNAAQIESNGASKRPYKGNLHQGPKTKKPKGTMKAQQKSNGDHDEVLLKDVRDLLKQHSLQEDGPTGDSAVIDQSKKNLNTLPELYSHVELTVKDISSTGDGLALKDGDSSHVYVVPFTMPGDKVTAKVFRHSKDSYSMTDLIKVETPSATRDDALVKCQYFATCSGCQFQMVSYDYQLQHKKRVVEKAYRNFSNLPSNLVSMVGDTIGSPLQYGYRTKLTPHFDGPPGARRSDGRRGVQRKFDEVPPIGFMKKNTRNTLDIEDCPIGTDAVRIGLRRERKRVSAELDKYKKGATLLMRETTERIPKSNHTGDDTLGQDAVLEDRGDFVHRKTCITDHKGNTTEYIDDYIFGNPANSFFQNNNSILPVFTQYIREHILPKTSDGPPISNLIDAYSGSGLFTITLSSLFKRSIGIDIAPSSIESANQNAKLNNLPESQASFIAADAAHLFAKIEFPPDETVVVIDPPRKGCDDNFLRQLLEFGPARVIYVSCNVHTQARDVGVLISGMGGSDSIPAVSQGLYEMESLRGFDFFPQTGHVESVAVLKKRPV